MANAMGRLISTVLSGYVYQVAGLEACLWISSVMFYQYLSTQGLAPWNEGGLHLFYGYLVVGSFITELFFINGL